MKIRTITCHDVYNFGASLQAYALQTYLESLGHDVKIINYKPWYLCGHYSLTKVYNAKYNKFFIKQLYILAKLPGRLNELKCKKVFDEFTKKYLHLTKCYNSYEELQENAPEADIYIAGSDQIWNTLFQNGRDKAFYLDFGKAEIKRISYAASFATSDIVSAFRDFVKKELKNIDYVSIREKSSLSLLETLGRLDGVVVCDPVFLLVKKQWNSLLSFTSKEEPYILVYLTDKSKEIYNIAKSLQKKTGWKIYVLGFKTRYGDKHFVHADPLDFVRLIRDARYVISNSFHATAFSLIMQIDFCVVKRSEDINERIKSLLEDYRLEDRLVAEYNDSLLNHIDFNNVDKIMYENIEYSRKWLSALIK